MGVRLIAATELYHGDVDLKVYQGMVSWITRNEGGLVKDGAARFG